MRLPGFRKSARIRADEEAWRIPWQRAFRRPATSTSNDRSSVSGLAQSLRPKKGFPIGWVLLCKDAAVDSLKSAQVAIPAM